MTTWDEPPDQLDQQALAEGLTDAPVNGHRHPQAPPSDDLAEASVLGAALNSRLAYSAAATAGLEAHHFLRSFHGHTWTALGAVGVSDAIAVAGWLFDHQCVEGTVLDIAKRLIRISAENGATSNADIHAKRVVSTWQRRRWIGSAAELEQAARTGDLDRARTVLASLGDQALPDGHVTRIETALLTSDQLLELPEPEPLLAGLLQRDSLAMLYGPAGLAKTFLAIDWALHVSYDAWWNGREVTGGPVLYVVAEGVAGIGPRLAAWRTHHRLTNDPVAWHPGAINLTDPDWAQGLARVVEAHQPALVVVDTYARCTVGLDENSGKDVGVVIDHLDAIRRASAACVLLVHHTGKDIDRGARGHSALRGAVDTELELTGDRTHMVLRNSKQKNAAEADPLHLALLDAGPSCVVVPTTTSWDQDDLPKRVAVSLTALEEVDDPGGVTATVWMAATGLAHGTFYRHRTGLLTSGLIVNVGSEKAPRYRAAHLLEVVS